MVDGSPARSTDVCLIPGISEGILTTGRATIAQAHQLPAQRPAPPTTRALRSSYTKPTTPR